MEYKEGTEMVRRKARGSDEVEDLFEIPNFANRQRLSRKKREDDHTSEEWARARVGGIGLSFQVSQLTTLQSPRLCVLVLGLAKSAYSRCLNLTTNNVKFMSISAYSS